MIIHLLNGIYTIFIRVKRFVLRNKRLILLVLFSIIGFMFINTWSLETNWLLFVFSPCLAIVSFCFTYMIFYNTNFKSLQGIFLSKISPKRILVIIIYATYEEVLFRGGIQHNLYLLILYKSSLRF